MINRSVSGVIGVVRSRGRRWYGSSPGAGVGCSEPGARAAAPCAEVKGSDGGGEGVGGDESEGSRVWERHVVSGLQPTGALHVGNYFGALRRCVRAQDDGDPLTLFVADLHALTTQHEAGGGGGAQLSERTLEVAGAALAAGVDPERSVLFAQSAVPRHAELCWLLACLCTQARLHHLPQYREKAARVHRGGGAGDGGEVPLGLLLYPVLQAADVLVQRGTHVPVGADQQQHLQLAAQLVRTFAHRHRPHPAPFPTPRAVLPEDGSDRIRSLRDPTRKMSKSDRDPRATILLTDSDDVIREKIQKAVTDCTPSVSFDPASRPGVANLVTLHCLAADLLPEEVVEESHALTTAQYKRVVADALCAALGPVRERARALRDKPRVVRDVLRAGAVRARARADDTYERVAHLAGLSPLRAPPSPRLHVLPAPAPAPSPSRTARASTSR